MPVGRARPAATAKRIHSRVARLARPHGDSKLGLLLSMYRFLSIRMPLASSSKGNGSGKHGATLAIPEAP